jgi:hypothetical protein
MYLRFVLPGILFVALLADQPCFAKDSHAQHGARARATTDAVSGKGATNVNAAPSKATAPIEPEQTVAPPVLRPQGVTQHQLRITNPNAKALVNAPHNQPGMVISTAPAARNAVGQHIIAPKNSVGTQPGISWAQRPSGVVSPPIVSPGSARVNVATGTNHANVNTATASRPVVAPGIGGPAQARYGLNGTTVQNRH